MRKQLKITFDTWQKLKLLALALNKTSMELVAEMVDERLRKEGLDKFKIPKVDEGPE